MLHNVCVSIMQSLYLVSADTESFLLASRFDSRSCYLRLATAQCLDTSSPWNINSASNILSIECTCILRYGLYIFVQRFMCTKQKINDRFLTTHIIAVLCAKYSVNTLQTYLFVSFSMWLKHVNICNVWKCSRWNQK